MRTYHLPVIVTRASNNYGPYQFPEKLIPLMISNALEGSPLPIYGDGLQVRDWLYVDDHCRAILAVLERGTIGEVYNIAGACHLPNIEVVKQLLKIVGASGNADHARDRSAWPRPPVRPARRQDRPRDRLRARGAVRGRPGAHRQVVPGERGLDGARPLGVYRDYYEQNYAWRWQAPDSR